MNPGDDRRHSTVTSAPALLFQLVDFAQVEIIGPDARGFLHSFCTNEIRKLEPGQGCEAFLPDIRGRILAHALVCVRENSLLLIAVPGANEVIVPHLRKYLLGIDAEVVDRTGTLDLLCLAGSEADHRLEFCLTCDVPATMQTHMRWTIAGEGETILRADLTVLPTLLISGSRESTDSLERVLVEGQFERGTPEQFEALRIEAGFPWHGRDISDENIAQEAGRTEQAISFRKGCYLGQEPIARLDAMGHTNKELRGLAIDAELVLPGSRVMVDEQEVGRITSAAFVPSLEKTLALGMIRTQHAAAGTELTVESRFGAARGVVFWPRFLPV